MLTHSISSFWLQLCPYSAVISSACRLQGGRKSWYRRRNPLNTQTWRNWNRAARYRCLQQTDGDPQSAQYQKMTRVSGHGSVHAAMLTPNLARPFSFSTKETADRCTCLPNDHDSITYKRKRALNHYLVLKATPVSVCFICTV